MKNFLILVFSVIFAVFCDFRRINIWTLKNRANNSKSNFKKQLYLFQFEKVLRKKGSWIGFNIEFKSPPVFPHGLFGIFISGSAKIGSNCVIFPTSNGSGQTL